MAPKKRKYVVSKDTKGGFWYAHLEGYPYVPVFGSIGTKSQALKMARLYNNTEFS